MRRPFGRTRLILFRHALILLRGRVLRWRLETYGLYAPSYPHQRPWWRVNPRALCLLLRHRRAYRGWLQEMSTLHTAGGQGWWQARLGSRYAGLREYVQRENRASEPHIEDERR